MSAVHREYQRLLAAEEKARNAAHQKQCNEELAAIAERVNLQTFVNEFRAREGGKLIRSASSLSNAKVTEAANELYRLIAHQSGADQLSNSQLAAAMRWTESKTYAALRELKFEKLVTEREVRGRRVLVTMP